VWSFDPAELFAGQQGGRLAVSLAVTGAEGGVTVWRAKAPTGYAVAGSVVTPGATQVIVPRWCCSNQARSLQQCQTVLCIFARC
jgi:hypothetical protein